MQFEIIAQPDAGGMATIATEDPREALASVYEFEAAAFRLIQVRSSGQLISYDTLRALALDPAAL